MSNGMPPGWYSGKDGLESYWDGDAWTKGPEAGPAEAEPAAASSSVTGAKQYTGKDWRNAGIGFVVLLVVGMAMVKGCSPGSSQPNRYNVQGTCKGLVKNNLKNPTTADFSGAEQTEASASGMVTAENALGGKVTYSYRCSRSGDTVRLESMTPR